MEKDTQHEFRRLVPEWAKSYYRALRARLLSLGLRPAGPIPLSGQERQASGTISVVVTVHDAPEVTRRCLSSLETFSGDAEVIIVDDGSRLESAKFMLNAFCSRNGWKLVRNDVALGHSRASEAGISVSMKPFICLLNSDTVVTPRSWLGIARAFDDSPQIAAVGPSTSHTPTPQRVLRAYHCRHYWSDEQIWCFAEQYVARHRKEPVVDLPYVGGFAFFVRRAIWDEMGGFDKHLPDYGNELEFCRRLTRRGLRIVWSKTSYIHHLGNESYGRTIGLAEIRERSLQTLSYIQNISRR